MLTRSWEATTIKLFDADGNLITEERFEPVPPTDTATDPPYLLLDPDSPLGRVWNNEDDDIYNDM